MDSAADLGTEDYNSLEQAGLKIWDMKQGSQRWSVYRYHNLQHNTLTFDDDHLPPDRKTAAARCKKFRKELGEIRKAAGSELRMIWTIENKVGEGRWHLHAVANATGTDDFADILRCWPYGSNVEIQRLQVNKKKNYESLARYMTKEARERPGLRSWSYTRNCRHPETESFPVPDDTRVEIPEGATVIQEEPSISRLPTPWRNMLKSNPIQLASVLSA